MLKNSQLRQQQEMNTHLPPAATPQRMLAATRHSFNQLPFPVVAPLHPFGPAPYNQHIAVAHAGRFSGGILRPPTDDHSPAAHDHYFMHFR